MALTLEFHLKVHSGNIEESQPGQEKGPSEKQFLHITLFRATASSKQGDSC